MSRPLLKGARLAPHVRSNRVSDLPKCLCGRETYHDLAAGLCCTRCGEQVKSCSCSSEGVQRAH